MNKLVALFVPTVLIVAACAAPAARGPVAAQTGSASPTGVTAAPTVVEIPKGVEYRGLSRPFVLLGGSRYEAKAGPIRADALDSENLQAIAIKAVQVFVSGNDVRPVPWRAVPTVYAVPGLDTAEGFLLRFPPDHSPTACSAGLTVFTADDAEPSPDPFSPPTREPGPDGVLPTPAPTPGNRPFFELSNQGILAAGWPDIWWGAAVIEYRSKVYRVTGGGYLDYGTAETSIPSSSLAAVETFTITYSPRLSMPEVLNPLRLDVPVTDHVAVYRPIERDASEVIVANPCPKEFRQAHFEYYEVADEPGDTPSEPTPKVDVATPFPIFAAVRTAEDMRAQFDSWPDEYKMRIDQDTVVLLAFPSPIIDWAWEASIRHIPSVSSAGIHRPWTVRNTSDGSRWKEECGEIVLSQEVCIERHYEGENGKARLEAALADPEIMAKILAGLRR